MIISIKRRLARGRHPAHGLLRCDFGPHTKRDAAYPVRPDVQVGGIRSLDQTHLNCVHCRLRTRVDVQLGKDPADVVLDRFFRKV